MRLIVLSALLALAAGPADADTLKQRIADAGDGWVHFECAAKEGVRGDGENFCIRNTGGHSFHIRHGYVNDDWGEEDWEALEPGPLHVMLRLRRGEVENVDLCVGDEDFRPGKRVRDLGEVDPAEAARLLLGFVAGEAGPAVDDCILPAVMTRGFDDWKTLIGLARNRRLDSDLREDCVFWLGQAAADEASRGLRRIVEDDDEELEVRKQAVFAISRQDTDESFDVLERIALNNPHPQLRRSALFWLSQLEDDRVVDLLEEILLED